MASKYDREIKEAMLSTNPWTSYHASGFKKYIKDMIQRKQGYYCCYCERDIKKESERIKHIEHILPKSKFPAYTFDEANLAISCVRCNSDRKGDDTSFLTCNLDSYKEVWSNSVYKSKNYHFIHPNLDKFPDHLYRKIYVKDNRVYCFYRVYTSKGEYHYKYFDLGFYVAKSISAAQGINDISYISESRSIINKLFKKHRTQ